MKNSLLALVLVSVFALFATVKSGSANSDDPRNARFNPDNSAQISGTSATDDNGNNTTSTFTPYYTDNFDLANDITGLTSRGYLVYYRGAGPQGIAPIWFQGNNTVFNAFNGADTSYVGSNFNSVTGANDIDNWLVLPALNVLAGDEISFRCRSVLNNPFPDSLRVMYNASGGSTPEDAGWVELGRFLAADDGTWHLKAYTVASSGLTGRFAIRYCVVDGGPFGDNSNYIGIDALNVSTDVPLPVELSSFVSTVSNNNVTLKWTTASELNNSGFDIERSVNGTWTKIGYAAGNGTSTVSNSYSFTDRNLASGSYSYRLKQIDFNGNFEYFNLSSEVNIGIPAQFELSQNYPNPFNPSTTINYNLPKDGKVSIRVFDMSGKEVAVLVNEAKTAGYYSINFNASALSSGVYYYSINADNFTSTKKMMLVK